MSQFPSLDLSFLTCKGHSKARTEKGFGRCHTHQSAPCRGDPKAQRTRGVTEPWAARVAQWSQIRFQGPLPGLTPEENTEKLRTLLLEKGMIEK